MREAEVVRVVVSEFGLVCLQCLSVDFFKQGLRVCIAEMLKEEVQPMHVMDEKVCIVMKL